MKFLKMFLLKLLWAATLMATTDHPAAVRAADDLLVGTDEYPRELLRTEDAHVTRVQVDGEARFEVATRHDVNWPGITLPAPGGQWDLADFRAIQLSVHNADSAPVTVYCRVDSPGGDGDKNSITRHVELSPGETKPLSVPLKRLLPAELASKLYGMRGFPGGLGKDAGIDTSRVTKLILFVNKPTKNHVFRIGGIRAIGTASSPKWLDLSAEEFFPMIDRLGQFIHDDWPGKAHSASELRNDVTTEADSLARNSAPPDWSQYGGWKGGPRLEPTGFFRPVKQEGKWWLVDPEGYLFWSHGADCVGFSQGTTPITDREFYFVELPSRDSPFAEFYGQASWAPHGYYEGKGAYRTYNFFGANLMRKYGTDWRARAAETIHKRLRSWGMNTIGNWSDQGVYAMSKTPYVVSAGSGGAERIEGSSGYWGKFPDPFDPSFRQALDRRLRSERGKSAGDPWCIGYFVDNELAWGDEWSLAVATLTSPPQQAAKRVFWAELRDKYQTIAKLNETWGTEHASWQALLESRTPPDQEKARSDLEAFYTRIAESYFRQCREAVKAVAPHNLYLGCRFAWVNDRGARAAAKYCDVIGYNLYRDSVAAFELPEGIDKPVIIGEFHFGALDRGMFHTGLRAREDQQARAQAYRDYVHGALTHPCFVGSHWFQYSDQATTGRGDGENYQIGLVNICDRPYPETIRAVREIGHSMYRLRYDRQASE